jgi:transcriptional regulator with XRE-family HTH domain
MKQALSKPGVKEEYDALSEEFSLLKEMIKARINSGKTQEAVARSMGTTTSVVGRLETGGGSKSHSPSIVTLKKYAEAVDCILQLKLIPKNIKVKNSANLIRSKQKPEANSHR